MLNALLPDPCAFLSHKGEISERIRGFDWSQTSIGPIEDWPQSLRTIISFSLYAKTAIVLFWGRDGIMIYNDAYAVFAGGRHPASLGARVLEAWPEVAEFNSHVMDIVLAGGTLSYRDQPLLLARNGVPEDAWLNIDYSPVLDEFGVPAGVLTLVKDTTERVRVEQRLRIAQEAGGVGVFEWYPETGLLEVSDQYRAIWGIGPDVVVTDSLLISLIHPDDRRLTGPARIHTENPLEYVEYRRICPKSGEIRWIGRRGEVVSSAEVGRRRFVGIAIDITARKTAELAVIDSEARFRSLAQSMPNHVWTAGIDGRLDWFNDRVYDYAGALPGSLDGDGWARMVHPSDIPPALEAWTSAIASGEPYQTEFRLRRNDGTYRWHIARAVPMRDGFGAIERWIGTNTDIEDRKVAEASLADLAATLEQRISARTAELLAAQDALRQAQKMESIGNLTGGVAHDFNNLLQVVSGNLQLLSRDIAGNERAERRVENAMSGVMRGSKLAAQLLAFGRRQPLAPKVVNVGRFIRNTDEILRRALGEGIEVETIIAGGLWNTLIDPVNVENALLNLAINARDAMNGQGKLTIEAGNAFLDSAYAMAHPDVTVGQYVLIAVSDTGSGMTADIVEKVFEPFFSTKPEGKGTGLGLSMVYGFVKQSGGHIKIYSEPGEGTTIKLYLPRSAQSEDVLVDVETGPITGGTETILVAEDDEAVRETVVATLGDLGYRVLKAKDAHGALTIIESGLPIDLVFTDVVMPGPLKSTELARKARERLPDVAVLFTSGYTENSIVHGGRLDEGVELLSKPYTREALARKLRHLLANRAQRLAVSAGPPRSLAVPPRPLTMLVCEDDPLIRMSTSDMLQDLGHAALEAEDAGSALALLRATAIDVLLTDIGLPDMSGVDLVVHARALHPGLAVILATGHSRIEGVTLDAMTHVVLKPFSSMDLKDAIAEIVKARSAAG